MRAGMPELQLTNEVVLTDGRVSWSHEGISIAHVVPEAFDDGPIGCNSDWGLDSAQPCRVRIAGCLPQGETECCKSHDDEGIDESSRPKKTGE